ncbi:MAG: ferritin-like domain-containing protein [Fimbriimonadaceae bacterium]
MKNTTFKDLYVEELQDLLSAENQLVEALPKIIDAVKTKELSDAMKSHLTETKGHVKRLKSVFELLGEKPKEKTCVAMKGLLKEGEHAIKEIEKGAVRDAAIIGACQRIEHYEMAAYGTARAFSKSLGYFDQAEILHETLEEESTANGTLTDIAVDTVNILASAKSMAGAKA